MVRIIEYQREVFSGGYLVCEGQAPSQPFACVQKTDTQTGNSKAAQPSDAPGNGHMGAPSSAAVDADELGNCELSV